MIIKPKIINSDYDYKAQDNKAKIKYQKKLKGEKVNEDNKKVKLGNINEDANTKRGCC